MSADFTPLGRLGYVRREDEHGNVYHNWSILNKDGTVRENHKKGPLAVLAKHYREEKTDLPEAYKKLWCRWCKYSTNVRDLMRTHHLWHKPIEGRPLCDKRGISWEPAQVNSHFRTCPVNGSNDELPGRHWLAALRGYGYEKEILKDFVCPENVIVGKYVDRTRFYHYRREWKVALNELELGPTAHQGKIQEAKEEIVKLNDKIEKVNEEIEYSNEQERIKELRQGSTTSPSLAKLTARQQVVYSRF